MSSNKMQHIPVLDPDTGDWDIDYIRFRLRAALKVVGIKSFRQFAKKHELSPNAVTKALEKPWYNVEKLIADTIGVQVSEIWSSRTGTKRMTFDR